MGLQYASLPWCVLFSKSCFYFPKEKQRDTAEVATQARKVGVPPRRLGHPGRYLTLVRLYKKRFLHLPTRICAVRKSDEKWRQYYLFPISRHEFSRPQRTGPCSSNFRSGP